jgi:3-hydroxyacyl-CoA dehydrogenase
VSPPAKTVAIVGAGLVGSGWAIVFARAGHHVRVHDADAAVRERVLPWITARLEDLRAFALIDEDPAAILARISIHADMATAARGADYVQESVFETLDAKRAVYGALDSIVSADVPIGSSTSGIPASAFTEACTTRGRMLIAHPLNPPYLIPLVELVPAPWTAPAIVDTVHGLMTAVGQEPIRVRREIEGFVLNRLQGALLNEAWALFAEGYASIADIDKTVAVGLGLRWSFMGPFETIDLNAPQGVADYAARLGPLYHRIAASRPTPKPWDAGLISAVEGERRADLAADSLDVRRAWRDRRLMALMAHQRQATKDIGS